MCDRPVKLGLALLTRLLLAGGFCALYNVGLAGTGAVTLLSLSLSAWVGLVAMTHVYFTYAPNIT